jgi:putative endonuclease
MAEESAGARAEQLALNFLISRGLTLVCQNYRCRLGEIDLIMQDRSTLVFVEVRYRRQSRFGGAAGSVSVHKQRKLTATALHYLGCVEQTISLPCRFDVVTFEASPRRCRWIRNAFDAPQA